MPESSDAPAGTFAELSLPVPLVQALRRAGLTTAFPIQAAVIPDILAGRDVLGRAATGSGKTLAFGLPLLVRLTRGVSAPKRPRGLILAPTRELALQIEKALDEPALALGLRLGTAVGGLPIKRQAERLTRVVDVLIATPGRLADLIAQRSADLTAVRVVTVDEADHMAQLGFLPQVTELLDQIPAGAQHLLFSATLDNAVDELITRYLRDPIRHAVDGTATTTDPASTTGSPPANSADAADSSPGSAAAGRPAGQPETPRSTADPAPGKQADSTVGQPLSASQPSHTPAIAHHLFLIRAADKRHVVAHIASRPGRTLLFVRTQYAADKLGRRLLEAGVPAVVMHGGRTQNQRTRALSAFTTGTASVLVATDVAARGIHVDDISLVLHVDPPADPKDYVHRAGRTARAGATGIVVTLATPDERATTEELFTAAHVPVTVTEISSGDRALTTLTAARRPTGRPVPDPAAPPTPDTPQKPNTPNNFRRTRAPGNRPRTRGNR